MSRAGLTLILITMCSLTSMAQTSGIAGIVIDNRTGQPLAGVIIAIKDQPLFVQSDADGRFRIDLPPGQYALTVTLVGYAIVSRTVDVAAGGTPDVTIRLSEGAGAFEEHVTVSGRAAPDVSAAPASVSLYGRDLQALRGATLDDPFRALNAVPSAGSTDDFYSEFAVRGSPFRQVGLAVDGIPSRYLMHAVYGTTDGGSIAMVNSDAVGSISLMPGGYPQRIGRHLGAEVDLSLRDGDRDRPRFRAGLSGTSAALLAEGPLKGHRGSWLVSARRSYLDLLLKRIDPEGSFAFGFTDGEAKVVFDLTPKHQLQVLALAGMAGFEEQPEELGPNDEAQIDGHSWLTGLTWRFTPSPRFSATQRVYATGLSFRNLNKTGGVLDDSASADAGWRGDAQVSVRPGVLVEFGADAQSLTARHARSRAVNDRQDLTLLNQYDQHGRAAGAHAQVVWQPLRHITIAPGARVDDWGPTGTSTASPWLTAEFGVTSGTRVRVGTGVYRQFADLEQINGIHGGGDALRPEVDRHLDLGIEQRLPLGTVLQATWYARDESDVLWTPGSEPRRLADGSIQAGRGDAPWVNTLDGRARGVEIVIRRDAPSGLSGWAGYAYGRLRYTEVATGESFWGDYNQRHALSLFAYYRFSSRTTVGAKFRYGSNYPIFGYIGQAAAAPGAPPLFGGEQPLFYSLSDSRNTLRLPAYARFDVRADHAFTWGPRRLTLFAELTNMLNHQNLRNVPYGVDRAGRVFGPTDTLLPIVPSAGLLIEF
jgi:hypothetical protein